MDLSMLRPLSSCCKRYCCGDCPDISERSLPQPIQLERYSYPGEGEADAPKTFLDSLDRGPRSARRPPWGDAAPEPDAVELDLSPRSVRRLPVGTRARCGDGAVEIVPRAVHEKLRRTRTMIFPGPELEPAPQPGSCAICFNDRAEETVTFLCGKHTYCADCVTHFFKDRIGLGIVPQCPAEGCGAEAGPELAQRLMGNRTFDKFLLAKLRATKRLHNCPGCGISVYVEDRTSGSSRRAREAEAGEAATSATCPECRTAFCVGCGLPEHPRRTCEDARRQRVRERPQDFFQELGEAAAALDLKQCPGCGAACEKSDQDACDHMTCAQCKEEFCWTCLADRGVIYAHGNHFHDPGCRFYAAFEGRPEYLPKRCRRCRRRGRACTPPRP